MLKSLFVHILCAGSVTSFIIHPDVLKSRLYRVVRPYSLVTPRSGRHLQRNLSSKISPDSDSVNLSSPDQASSPSSTVYYDDVASGGVVCARGICVLEDVLPSLSSLPPSPTFMDSFWAPRILLALASILYGTNFPLGYLMNQSLPPSFATSSRLLLSFICLLPFLPSLSKNLIRTSLLCGVFTSMGYISQSIALETVDPSTVGKIFTIVLIKTPHTGSSTV